MSKATTIDDGLVQSVTRAFDVLFAVAETEQPPSARTVAERLDLPRSTVHRILNTLVASGVVSRVGSNRGYAVTPKLAMSMMNSRGASLGAIAEPYLHRLVAVSEETASIHIRTGDLRTCVAEVQGLRGIRWVRGRGWSAPIWSGAVGRVLLAGLPDHELETLLERSDMQPLARNSVVDRGEMRRLVHTARRQGWSSSESETIDGAAAIAVPIRDDGGTIAALSLYAPADRVGDMLELVDELQIAAQDLGRHWIAISTVQSGAASGGAVFNSRQPAN
ncbi:MAG: IclR family transcriptional regulator [Acidimicrobiia bacterium]|nr:IclR family transcriptional regulator [Acidimicrobiia bacterium]